LLALEQHDICATTQGEMIGNAATNNSATNDYDAGIFREVGHLVP
jgi:hypothetical protein